MRKCFLGLAASLCFHAEVLAANQQPVERRLIRTFESLQSWWREQVRGEDGKGYFLRVIPSKFAEYPHHPMPAITSRYVALGKAGAGGRQLAIGRLPSARSLEALRRDFAGDGEFELVSVVEPFELAYAIEKAGLPAPVVELGRRNFPEGRFALELDPGDGSPGTPRALGVSRWTQFSTRDRAMLTQEIARALALHLLEILSQRKRRALVHCKSGKGRSATAVVGARTALVLARWLQQDPRPAKRAVRGVIPQLLAEQIAQVRKVRPQVGVSFFQRYNLRVMLTQLAEEFYSAEGGYGWWSEVSPPPALAPVLERQAVHPSP